MVPTNNRLSLSNLLGTTHVLHHELKIGSTCIHTNFRPLQNAKAVHDNNRVTVNFALQEPHHFQIIVFLCLSQTVQGVNQLRTKLETPKLQIAHHLE